MRPGPPVVLRSNPWKMLGAGAVCLLLAIGGGWMARQGRWEGWFGLIGFGIGAIVSAIAAMPNASYLKLDADGFTVCAMYRPYTIRWSDVTGFDVGRVGLNKKVMYDFAPTSTLLAPRLRSLNVALAEYEASIPDNYGLAHEELADLMNRYREAALAA